MGIFLWYTRQDIAPAPAGASAPSFEMGQKQVFAFLFSLRRTLTVLIRYANLPRKKTHL